MSEVQQRADGPRECSAHRVVLACSRRTVRELVPSGVERVRVRRLVLVGAAPLEELDVLGEHAVAALEHHDVRHEGVRMHAELGVPPALTGGGRRLTHDLPVELGIEHLDEEVRRLAHVRHDEADVIQAHVARNSGATPAALARGRVEADRAVGGGDWIEAASRTSGITNHARGRGRDHGGGVRRGRRDGRGRGRSNSGVSWARRHDIVKYVGYTRCLVDDRRRL